MASIQKFESIKGNIFYVTMFDGETVTLPHQNIQNNTIALIRGNGVVALSSGETTINGSAFFLFYNNKWNYVTPEVTRERLDGVVEKLNQTIETLSEELGAKIDRIDGEITDIQGDLEELKPQEYVLQIVPETGLEMVEHQTYKIGNIIFMYVRIINNSSSRLTIEANQDILKITDVDLIPNTGRIGIVGIATPTIKARTTNLLGPTDTLIINGNNSFALNGFLFTN